jgi:3-oxoadipate enol-lactonase
MPVTEIDGIEIFYEELGEGEPVVLLNGILMTTRSWALQTRCLATRYRCILHDFRGQLRSGKPPGPYRLERHVADLLELLDRLEVDRAHLIGTSYGGEIGLLFALTHPERVRSLAAISCVSRVDPSLREKVHRWAEAARSRPEQVYDVSLPDNFSQRFRREHPEVIELGRRRLAECPPEFFEALAWLVEAFATLDVTGRLPEITVPTLVLCGGEDELKPPSSSRVIARGIPGAELLVIPEAGHAVVLERPEEVNTALLGFLAKHARDPERATG